MDALYVLLGLGLILLFWAIAVFNRFASLKNHIRESWSGIDIALQRRHDLIPNLIEIVKGYATHERELLQRIAEAREKAVLSMAHLEPLAADETTLVRSLNELFARVEAYPELKASTHFLELQRELANTEDRIAAARRFYNANVRDYNTLIETFPAGMIGGIGGHVKASFFEVESLQVRQVPSMSLG